MKIKKTPNYCSWSVCRRHDNTRVSFMGSGHTSCVSQLRSSLWLMARCCGEHWSVYRYHSWSNKKR